MSEGVQRCSSRHCAANASLREIRCSTKFDLVRDVSSLVSVNCHSPLVQSRRDDDLYHMVSRFGQSVMLRFSFVIVMLNQLL